MMARLRAAIGGGTRSARIVCSATAFQRSTMSGREGAGGGASAGTCAVARTVVCQSSVRVRLMMSSPYDVFAPPCSNARPPGGADQVSARVRDETIVPGGEIVPIVAIVRFDLVYV